MAYILKVYKKGNEFNSYHAEQYQTPFDSLTELAKAETSWQKDGFQTSISQVPGSAADIRKQVEEARNWINERDKAYRDNLLRNPHLWHLHRR